MLNPDFKFEHDKVKKPQIHKMSEFYMLNLEDDLSNDSLSESSA